MIPRVIHSAWFGGAPKPDLVKRCEESWRRHLPDWEFREWSEETEDVYETHHVEFFVEAMRRGRWAFAWDYVRLLALWHHGGVTLDADVEVLRPLDGFLRHRAFTGHEADTWWLSATMGAEPHHPWIGMLLNYYRTAAYDETPNTQVVTRLSQGWLEREEGGFRYLREGVVIYPTEYFTGFRHDILQPVVTENSHCTHWFCGSWLGRPERRV